MNKIDWSRLEGATVTDDMPPQIKYKNMSIAIYYPYLGEQRKVQPENGKTFTYQELQTLIGGSGYIEIVPLPSGRVIVVDEEGKLKSEEFWEVNEPATEIWKLEYPIAQYPNNNDELIVGNALICDSKLIN